jgi:hypothetical protein
MRITKRQLRRIIKEELLREQGPLGVSGQIDNDMQELLQILKTAESKAAEIDQKMQDVEYGQHAGGREADDLQLALIKVWHRFGMKGEDL